MHVNPIVNSKFIYQYGNIPDDIFVFYKGGFNKLLQTGIKEVTETSAFMDGDVDLLDRSKSRKSSYILDIDFTNQYSSPYSPDYVSKVFMGRAKYCFFYDYSIDTSNPYPEKNINKFYYNNHVRSVKPPDPKETERENRYDGEEQNSVILKMNKPYFFDCSEAIEFLSYKDYLLGIPKWDNTTWDNSYWDNSPLATGLVSTLSNSNKVAFFSDVDPSKVNYFVILKDRFFAREQTTARRYVINNTYTAGSFTDTPLTSEFNNVTANTSIYRFEISTLSAGQNIQINNITNNSGVKITWRGSNSSGYVVFNSYYGKLYATTLENDIDDSMYDVEVIGGETLNFTGLYNPFRVLTLNSEIIRITPSLGSNPNIKIDVLPTYD